jgi:hypothetical protein
MSIKMLFRHASGAEDLDLFEVVGDALLLESKASDPRVDAAVQ